MLVVTHPNPSSYPTSNARTLRIIVESKPDRCERLPFDRKDVQGIDTPFAFLDATSSSPKREDALFSPLYSMEDLWQRCKHHEGINYVKDCEFWDAESARFHKQFKTSSLIDFLKNRSHREKKATASTSWRGGASSCSNSEQSMARRRSRKFCTSARSLASKRKTRLRLGRKSMARSTTFMSWMVSQRSAWQSGRHTCRNPRSFYCHYQGRRRTEGR